MLLQWFVMDKGMNEVPRGLFERQDKNRDGAISFEEFDGPKGEL